MNILKSMAYTAVAAVAAYNVYLAADIQQVKSDLTFDTIELTASGAEPGGDNSRIIDDSCSPGSPAWYAKMFGDSYGQSGGPGRDPYCENALYGHDSGNKAYSGNDSNNGLIKGRYSAEACVGDEHKVPTKCPKCKKNCIVCEPGYNYCQPEVCVHMLEHCNADGYGDGSGDYWFEN